MPKTRQEKKEIIDQLAQDLKDSSMVVIADYQGLSNPELQELRDRLKREKAKLQIVKNSLFEIALKKAGLEIDQELFSHPLALSFSKSISSAKSFEEVGKEAENLEVLGGIYQKEYQDREYIKRLAQIPSREELLIQLVGQLKAPQYGLVYVLKGNLIKLIYLLKEKVKEEK